MDVRNKVIVVTGGAHGIGRALCLTFAQQGARGIVVGDIDEDSARAVAGQVQGTALRCDVSVEKDVQSLVQIATDTYGPVDLFCANAGIVGSGGVETSNEDWQRTWDVNFMSHVYAARAVLPAMIERGEGYLLHTASAAGLLTQIGSATYSVTKHAVVALAEWLSITHAEQGIRVSCLCPMGVHTNMLAGDGPVIEMLRESAIEPEQVARDVIEGLREERFLILPHVEVATYFQRKANDFDRWLRGMRQLRKMLYKDESEESHG